MDDHPGGDEVLLSSTGFSTKLILMSFSLIQLNPSNDMFLLLLQGKMLRMTLKTLDTATPQGTWWRSTTSARSIRLVFQKQGHTLHLLNPRTTKTRHQNSSSRFCSSSSQSWSWVSLLLSVNIPRKSRNRGFCIFCLPLDNSFLISLCICKKKIQLLLFGPRLLLSV